MTIVGNKSTANEHTNKEQIPFVIKVINNCTQLIRIILMSSQAVMKLWFSGRCWNAVVFNKSVGIQKKWWIWFSHQHNITSITSTIKTSPNTSPGFIKAIVFASRAAEASSQPHCFPSDLNPTSAIIPTKWNAHDARLHPRKHLQTLECAHMCTKVHSIHSVVHTYTHSEGSRESQGDCCCINTINVSSGDKRLWWVLKKKKKDCSASFRI